MERTLPDSSVWIDHFNGVETPQVLHLRHMVGTDLVVVGDLVRMEVLRGVRDDLRHARIRRALNGYRHVNVGALAYVLRAGDNYRALRKLGITVRSAVDCLIATYCIETGTRLLHSDSDFDPFEEHLGLAVARLP